MASESTALSTEPATAANTEPPTAGDQARNSERRLPSARDPLATLPELDASDFDFEPHDTIPAPTWLDDEPSPPHETP